MCQQRRKTAQLASKGLLENGSIEPSIAHSQSKRTVKIGNKELAHGQQLVVGVLTGVIIVVLALLLVSEAQKFKQDVIAACRAPARHNRRRAIRRRYGSLRRRETASSSHRRSTGAGLKTCGTLADPTWRSTMTTARGSSSGGDGECIEARQGDRVPRRQGRAGPSVAATRYLLAKRQSRHYFFSSARMVSE
jgi:hypothetical protein